MKYRKETFIIGGLVLGLLYGIWPIIKAYREFPNFPGMFELAIQLLIVGFFGVVGGVLGFLLSLVVILFQKKGS